MAGRGDCPQVVISAWLKRRRQAHTHTAPRDCHTHLLLFSLLPLPRQHRGVFELPHHLNSIRSDQKQSTKKKKNTTLFTSFHIPIIQQRQEAPPSCDPRTRRKHGPRHSIEETTERERTQGSASTEDRTTTQRTSTRERDKH